MVRGFRKNGTGGEKLAKKRNKGPKQVTVHGVTYQRSSGVDTAMIQRYKEKIRKELKGKRGKRRKR